MVINQLKQCRDKIKYVHVVEKILHYLTHKYDYLVCVIDVSKDHDSMSVKEL